MEENISQFLNRNKEKLEFERFYMLEEEGMMVEVKVDGVEYTFACNVEGEIVGVRKRNWK